MKKRGLWALVLSAAMIATTLAGCGGGGATQTTAAGSTTAAATTKAASNNTTTTAAAGTEAAATTAAAANSGEVPTIVIFNNWSTKVPGDKEAYEDVQNYILENLGIKVEVSMAPTNGSQKLSTMLASGEQLDIWWGSWEDYYKDGIILPINQYLESPDAQPIKDAWDPSNGWMNTTDNEGNIWAIPRMPMLQGSPIFVRNDWLDLLGMEQPKNFDELNKYLYAIKELDPYGNGETIPLLLQGGGNPVANTAACLLGGYTKYGQGRFVDETDGKVKPEYLADGYVDFIKQMHQWYVDGIIHKEFMTHATTDVKELASSGRVAATAVWYSRIVGQDLTLKEIVDLDTSKHDYVLGWNREGVIGPNGQYMQCRYLGNRQGQLISSKCKNPEAAIKFTAWAYEPDNQRILKYGLEGKYWEWDPNVENARELGAVRKIEGAPAYNREFDVALGPEAERREIIYNEDGIRNMANIWLCEDTADVSITTYNPVEGETVFGTLTLDDVAPMGDVNTYFCEEIAKFVKGDRSFDTWDAFIQDLYDLGLDAYIEECTRQYNELHK